MGTIRKLSLILVLAILLSACAPLAVLRIDGALECMGSFVSATELRTAGHCYQANEAVLPTNQVVRIRLKAVDAREDWAVFEPEAPVWYPFYADFREPEPLQEATLAGLCPSRIPRETEVVYAGILDAGEIPGPRQDGLNPIWFGFGDDGIVCPGDSGSPLLDPNGPADGVWPAYGIVSWAWLARSSFYNPYVVPYGVVFGTSLGVGP